MKTYGYKVTLQAPFITQSVVHCRGRGREVHKIIEYATVTRYIYGQANIKAARETLINDLPNIRAQAGVMLTKPELIKKLDARTVRLERISH
jgi:hypothetical protein